jgi:uncharacterized 2Fe-2S/4Fe-4S cluster protein (DUF4445 family)
MIIESGDVKGDVTGGLADEEVAKGMVLACLTRIESDLTVRIPSETHAEERVEVNKDAQRFTARKSGLETREFAKIPLVEKVFLTLSLPSLDDNLADEQRLERDLGEAAGVEKIAVPLAVVRRLPAMLRGNEFSVTVIFVRNGNTADVIDVEGGDTSAHNYMLVVDVGTTTVVVHLVDVVGLETLDAQACFNSQSVHGRELTTRIMAAEKLGNSTLQELIVGDINELTRILVKRTEIDASAIHAAVFAGNTTMMHFLLDLPAENIRRNPYIAASVELLPSPVDGSGIGINPNGRLFTVPGISSWVGGDLTAGILAVDLHEKEEVCMLVDVGTNGEIILGCKEWMVACSASTGPALEGASLECGMMGEKGAVEAVSEGDGKLEYKVIGDVAAKGICGSGIIDLIAVLLQRGTIDRSGSLVEGSDPNVVVESGERRFVLSEGVYLTQADIGNIITAKAAVFAAMKILLDRMSLSFSDVSMLFLGGGFGSFIDVGNAIAMGFLPDLPRDNIRYAGNTSLWGAKLAAFSREAYDELSDIRTRTTYYDLMGTDDYVDQFQQAMFLPHTDIGLFPSTRGGKG